MRHPLRLESLPLLDEVLLALGASLHPAGGVNRARSAGPRVFDQAGKKRLHRGVGQLLRSNSLETSPRKAVSAHVAHLGRRVLVGHAEVQDVGAS